jgi:hypothetical protein
MLISNELIGFAVGGVSAVSFISSDDDFTSITPPSQGDLIILWGHSGGTPSGFTNIYTDGNEFLSYKLSNGTETGFTDSGVVAIFRADGAISSVLPNSIDSELTNGDPSSQLVTASAAKCPAIVIAAYVSSGNVLISSAFTPDADGFVNESDNTRALVWKIYNQNPQDHTVDMGDAGSSNYLVSCYIEIS